MQPGSEIPASTYPPPFTPSVKPPLSAALVATLCILAVLIPILGGFAALIVGLVCHGRRRAQTLIIVGAIVPVLNYFLYAVVVRSTMAASYYIPSSAMEPALKPGQYIIGSKAVVQLYGLTPQRGEIWIFEYPLNRRQDYIKRVVGLPGETIEISGGQLLVNGQITVIPEWSEPPSQDYPPTPIPPSHYFVMGDNTNRSSDSRVWGTVPLDHFQARYWFHLRK
jgi:signal peptidase I